MEYRYALVPKYELYHHGTKGQKKGVRRYQNLDGSLTPAGRLRYYGTPGNRSSRQAMGPTVNKSSADTDETNSTSTKKSSLTLEEMAKANREAKIRSEYAKNNPDKLTVAKNAIDDASKATRELSNIEKQSRPKPKKEKMDLSNMSDKEMRDKINRELLERQYNDMFAPQKVNRGRERVGKIIEGTSIALGIGASALGIAVGIKQLLN